MPPAIDYELGIHTAPCTHHTSHPWRWCEVPDARPNVLESVRKWARVAMQTLCPAPGDVLTWEPIRPDEPWNSANWTLRHGHRHVEDGETAIAIGA